MKIIDFLLEDHKKRSFFIVLVFSALVIIELYNTWILGYHMGSCQEVMDLLKLTSIPAVRSSLAGRLVINYLDFHATESGFKIVLRSMSLLNWLMIMTALILVFGEAGSRCMTGCHEKCTIMRCRCPVD